VHKLHGFFLGHVALVVGLKDSHRIQRPLGTDHAMRYMSRRSSQKLPMNALLTKQLTKLVIATKFHFAHRTHRHVRQRIRRPMRIDGVQRCSRAINSAKNKRRTYMTCTQEFPLLELSRGLCETLP